MSCLEIVDSPIYSLVSERRKKNGLRDRCQDVERFFNEWRNNIP